MPASTASPRSTIGRSRTARAPWKGSRPSCANSPRSEFLRTSLPGFIYCGEQLGARRHTLDDLARVRVPTLVVRGESEGPGLVQVAEDLARTIPGARYEVIPGAGHSPQMESPVRFNEVLLDFLASL